MGTTNNWVADGLNSYLALTGEKRAQDKAASDLDYQKQSMQLAQNADQRAGATAGLTNQLTGYQINDAKAKDDDRNSLETRLRNYIKIKQRSSMPNTLEDADGIARTTQDASDLIQTGHLLKGMPPGTDTHLLNNLPDYAQRVLQAGPGAAALKRKGEVHTDPTTGQTYTMTGDLGPLRTQDGVAIPSMLAQNQDGSMREVPFTPSKTNGADEGITTIDGNMMATRGSLQLTAIKNAQAKGTSPADESADHIYQMLKTMPHSEQEAWMKKDLEKSTARDETAAYDASIALAAKPYLDKVSKLKGTAAERADQFLQATVGAPSSVIAYLKANAEVSGKLFEGQEKREDAKLIAKDKIEQSERENKRDNETRRAMVAARSGGENGKTPAQNQSYELWKKVYMKRGHTEAEADTMAEDRVSEGKSNPSKDITALATSLLKEGVVKNMTDAISQAKSAYSLLDTKPAKTPAANDMQPIPSHGPAYRKTTPASPATQGRQTMPTDNVSAAGNFMFGDTSARPHALSDRLLLPKTSLR